MSCNPEDEARFRVEPGYSPDGKLVEYSIVMEKFFEEKGLDPKLCQAIVLGEPGLMPKELIKRLREADHRILIMDDARPIPPDMMEFNLPRKLELEPLFLEPAPDLPRIKHRGGFTYPTDYAKRLKKKRANQRKARNKNRKHKRK